MEDGDAHFARWVNIGVEDWCLEFQLWGHQRVSLREGHSGAKEATCFVSISRLTIKMHIGMDGRTSVILAVVIDHEHYFPLEDIVVSKTTTDPRYVFVRLHLFQLPLQQRRGGRREGHSGY